MQFEPAECTEVHDTYVSESWQAVERNEIKYMLEELKQKVYLQTLQRLARCHDSARIAVQTVAQGRPECF